MIDVKRIAFNLNTSSIGNFAILERYYSVLDDQYAPHTVRRGFCGDSVAIHDSAA